MSTQYSPKVITDGLVLALDAGNPKSYISGSLNWNNLLNQTTSGSLTNGPTFSTASGGAIVFDGVNDTCPVNNQTFNSTTGSSFTIETVFKRNSSTPGTFKVLYLIGIGGATNARTALYFDNNNNGQIAINYYTNASSDPYVTLNPQLLDTNFHHAVQVIDKNTLQMTGYFDGVNKGSATITGSSTSDTVFRVAGVGSCNAAIALVRIYNRALTAAEVQQNYNTTKTRFGL
jgi:hypothetical protein